MLATLARRLDFPVHRAARLGYFLALGVAMIAAHAVARTAAEAVFLANVGPSALPIYFILVGLGSVPIAAGVARLIDRLPRARLYQASLIVAGAAIVGLRFLVALDTRPAYFAVIVGVVVLEMLMVVQFWVLVSDYFSTLEQKRMVPFLTIGAAFGGMVGGILANVLSRFMGAADVLLAFPVLYAIGFLVFARLRRTQTALQTEDDGAGSSAGGAIAEIWGLVKGYPIVVLLATVGFLEVLLGGMGSYLSYTIYTESFPDEQQLTAFLGTLRAALSVLQVVVIFFVTRPLVHRMGVGRMNLIYPSTTLASLGGLAFFPILPVAVLGHVNFSTIAVGVAGPVENLTYNAVPPRFLGRVRTVSEALLQPTGLAAGGILLYLVQDRMTFQQIALLTLGVAGLMMLLGWVRARAYLRALQSQLRDRSLDLSRDERYLAQLHGKYADEVRSLLTSPDPDVRAVGIELAARIDPDRYLPDVLPGLAELDTAGRAAAISLLQKVRSAAARQDLVRLLDATMAPAGQAAVLEGLLATRSPPPEVPVDAMLDAEDARVRGLAVTFALRTGLEDAALARLDALDHEALEYAVRGAAALPVEATVPVLIAALERGTHAATEQALRVLRRLSPRAGERARYLAAGHTAHEDDAVRAAAYELLAADPRELDRVVAGLGDAKALVRNRVALALGDVGRPALPFLERTLQSPSPDVVQAALRALGRMRTARAAELAFEHLQRDYVRAERCTEWLARAPTDDPDWRPLRIALEDSNRRAVDAVLEVLGAFGHQRTLRHARMALASRDERLRANAVETLASLPDRKFVLPVIDLLEALASRQVDGVVGEPGARDAAPIEELLEMEDRWVRAGAVTALRNLGRPVPDGAGEETDMSRLLFLKNVSLFQGLSLDNLMVLDEALRRRDYLPGEQIFAEGSTGDDLYIVLQGEVVVEKGTGTDAGELARIGPGEFFGEMALFDDEPRSATCRAATATTLLSLDRGRFHSLIEQVPRLGIEISRVLSLRLRRTSGSLHRSVVEAR